MEWRRERLAEPIFICVCVGQFGLEGTLNTRGYLTVGSGKELPGLGDLRSPFPHTGPPQFGLLDGIPQCPWEWTPGLFYKVFSKGKFGPSERKLILGQRMTECWGTGAGNAGYGGPGSRIPQLHLWPVKQRCLQPGLRPAPSVGHPGRSSGLAGGVRVVQRGRCSVGSGSVRTSSGHAGGHNGVR